MKPGTALPWYTGSSGTHQGLVISEVTAENVAVTYHGQQDAAYIVQACNAYPEMLKTLLWVREYVEPWRKADNAAGTIYEQVERAIRTAEGGES